MGLSIRKPNKWVKPRKSQPRKIKVKAKNNKK
jgi:hypothetical protein